MQNLAKYLSPIQLKLDDLLLDANNPRFSALGEELSLIPEARFIEEKVQAKTFDKMKDDVFDVSELKDTIKTIGFLPMDRIVVRLWVGSTEVVKKYVVVEGNRRVAALKWLINLHEAGKETFDTDKLKNFTEIECLLLDSKQASATANLILPGLRHVSGIKEWGAYQKAKTVHALRTSGMTAQEAAQSLGLSTKAANSSYRCFLALENMKKDEEYGDSTDSRMYSYFEETFKRPIIKDWLGWDEEKGKFTNTSRLNEFYGWMTPTNEDGNETTAKLPEAKSIRELAQIISDDGALNVLRSPEGSLSRALARYEVDHPEDWYPKILSAIDALKSLTIDMLRSIDQITLDKLDELEKKIVQTKKDRIMLMGDSK